MLEEVQAPPVESWKEDFRKEFCKYAYRGGAPYNDIELVTISPERLIKYIKDNFTPNYGRKPRPFLEIQDNEEQAGAV